MIDLGPFNAAMKENFIKFAILGAFLIAGSLFFKWLGNKMKSKKSKRYQRRRSFRQ